MAEHRGSNDFSFEFDKAAFQRVLAYLREMEEVCRDEHRQDLARDYRDARSIAVRAIYGELPPRQQSASRLINPEIYAQNQQEASAANKTKPMPPWRKNMLAKPYRLILRTIHSEDGDEEFLECGHRVWASVTPPGQRPARRRRCPHCANSQESKKPVSASAQSSFTKRKAGIA